MEDEFTRWERKMPGGRGRCRVEEGTSRRHTLWHHARLGTLHWQVLSATAALVLRVFLLPPPK